MAIDFITAGKTGLEASTIIFGNDTKLANNANPIMLPAGAVAVTINYGTGAIGVTVPINTRVVYGEINYLLDAEVNVSTTAPSNYRFLAFDAVTKAFSLIAETDRLDFIVLAIIPTYGASHQTTVFATNWTLNGEPQTGISLSGLVASIAKLANNIDPLIIPGGSLAMTVNYSTGAVSLSIPAGSRIVHGDTSYVTGSAQVLADTIGSYRYIVFNTSTNLLEFATESTRLNNVIVGWVITYGASHQTVLFASQWSLNGFSQLPYNEGSLLNSGVVPKNYSFYLNPTSATWNYNAFMRLEATEGDYTQLLKPDGTPKELFFVFVRFEGLNGNVGGGSIIQLAEKVGSTVGVGNVAVASAFDMRDVSAKPIIEYAIIGDPAVGFGGIKWSILVDVAKVPASFLSDASVGGSIQLNTLLFVEQLKAIANAGARPLLGKEVVQFGDSVWEFGDIPAQIAGITGANTYNIGFGGCRMCKRVSTDMSPLMYNELGMYAIANSIATGDFTDMAAAVEWLKVNEGDDNTANFNRLTSIDFDNVDYITIGYGTNDFSGGENPIGAADSMDVMTIKGAMNYVVDKLLTAYPHLKIVFITPTHRFWGVGDAQDSDTDPNALGLFLGGICEAIVDCAHSNHVNALNMYTTSGLNKYNHFLYFGGDGAHPLPLGNKLIAERISAFLVSVYKYL